MNSLKNAAAFLFALHTTHAVEVGDEVCITGYVLDGLCITQGFFLDAQDTNSLEFPEEHTFHCLIDPPQCVESGYQVLGPKNETTGMHCLGFRFDNTTTVVELAKTVGQKGLCTSCTNEDANAPERGWLATVKGTVSALGDGSDGVTGTPILSDFEIMDGSVGCVTEDTVPPLCMARSLEDPDDGAMGSGNEDCTQQMCSVELTPGYMLQYQVNEAEGTVTMEATFDGEAFVAVGFSTNGEMIGSEAVIGIAGENGDIPQKYNLGGKSTELVTTMPAEQQTLTDASVEVVDGQTVMKFTKILIEPNEIPVDPNVESIMLWALGSDFTLGYHRGGKGSFGVTLAGEGGSDGAGTTTVAPTTTTVAADGAATTTVATTGSGEETDEFPDYGTDPTAPEEDSSASKVHGALAAGIAIAFFTSML
mmetsp:Transcript_644/g.1162  ORF Transcript_644/g.1162 Transcript_644/m.1162 type:complete len:421 (-) Transcript_644:95-1357(-)